MERRDKRRLIILLVLISLWVDGFCLGYLFNATKKKSQPRTRQVAQAEELIIQDDVPKESPPVPSQSPVILKTVTNEIPEEKRYRGKTKIVQTPYKNKYYSSYQKRKIAQVENSEDVPQKSAPLPEYSKPSHYQTGTTTAAIEIEKTSPFLRWPRLRFEMGAAGGIESFQSTMGSFSLNNTNLNEDQGYYLKGQYSLNSRLVAEASLLGVSGTIPDNSGQVVDTTFQTTGTTISLRYRAFSDEGENVGYYFGLGAEQLNSFRYSYLSNTSTNVVNRPITFNSAKLSIGSEYHSYYLFRGRFEASYYLLLNALPGGNTNNVAFSNFQDGTHFSLEGSLSRVIVGDIYFGLQLQYFFHNYSFTTNELGPTLPASVTNSGFTPSVFLGAEL